ncbi:alpha/beta hydrolase [Rufibacter radiotolerans]|uniref:Alpha/beta hydrolase n=1 Tax=Rufibacter radiotolerans TaxID=1379910 RepID=A0A0H4VJP5_9BACT|nr:alpha/beta fold hydrolase [Rufibacter radiotolerans]AKQ45568.1 alpha/beta hydrolase [Rufibacter radiotolerans]
METKNWVDRLAYPFKENYLQVPGGRLHYVDEGTGAPLLFVHGTPTWSFLWRHQIKELSKQYRCIAVDHLGFGLSDKPKSFSYSLEDHRQNLGRLVDHLGLNKVNLVVHDFGGSIGLGWAVRNPDKVSRLVIMNTWMWPVTEVKPMMQASKLFSSWLGKLLYINFNLSPRFLLPQAFFQKEKLTKEIHSQYLGPFQKEEQRWGLWYFAKALAGEAAYFQEIYNQRPVLLNKPTLLIWGKQDKLIPYSFLEKWKETLPMAKVVELNTGHFMQEEEPETVTTAIQEFLTRT